VLKITPLSGKGRVQIIRLEGQILAPWVQAVREACTQPERRSKQLVLDLTAVTYVDGPGSQLLRDLVGDGIHIGACSSFLAELLDLEE
jgi:anti-anti-sigma regulatory factor